MTFKKYSFVLVFAIIFAMLIVACNNEVQETGTNVTVSFAPSVGKALNQDGKTGTVSTSLTDYRWEYWVSAGSASQPDTISRPGESDWKAFEDASTGLGTIKNLEKNYYYSFGLRGYSIGDNPELVWEGFTYSNYTSKTLNAVQLQSKKMMITIDVDVVGSGRLFFNISAPSYLRLDESYPDRFVFSYGTLAGNGSSATDTYLVSTYDADSDAFFYQTSATDAELVLKADDYLFTVWQETWDPEEGTSGAYVKIPGRKQVVIATIQSGVDTVIAGTLDSSSSTGLIKFDYEGGGYTDENLQHILTSFTDADPVKVHEFKTAVTNKNGTTLVKATRNELLENNYFEIGFPDNDYGVISWTSTTDDVHLYVNGEKLLETADYPNYTSLTNKFGTDLGYSESELKFTGKFVTFTTNSNDYCVRREINEANNYTGKLEVTMVRVPDASGNKLIVEGKKDYVYLLTLQYKTDNSETESVVFSVRGGVILVTGIELNATQLTLSLNPGVQFIDTTAWLAAGISLPSVEYFKVSTPGATSGGTSVGSTVPTTSGDYYAVVSITGSDNKTATVVLPTHVN